MTFFLLPTLPITLAHTTFRKNQFIYKIQRGRRKEQGGEEKVERRKERQKQQIKDWHKEKNVACKPRVTCQGLNKSVTCDRVLVHVMELHTLEAGTCQGVRHPSVKSHASSTRKSVPIGMSYGVYALVWPMAQSYYDMTTWSDHQLVTWCKIPLRYRVRSVGAVWMISVDGYQLAA